MLRILSALLLLIVVSPALAQKEFGFDNRKGSGQPYLKPEESVAKMKVADGFEVKLFAAEPDVINPIAMTVDEKGRVWVIECFEYPKRTAKGKMPRDRIVILEDTKGTGVCDKRTVFAEGKDFPVPFDLASGLEVGNGGVYVGAPPYLFFIENKNDKPGKFEILLKGFGSQDTHETLNTFQWGPDGWLYGLHGIYTQSEVKPYGDPNAPGTKMNAAVWRLHPKTKKFEIFSEGTSNPWGMDWRNTDGQFILACCVIPHLFHMVPGGNYKRQGGQGLNPYAYGEIKEICDHTFHRESGWAHAGLISLDTPLMPEKYRNSVIFGSIHGCSLKQNILKPNGSSYTASRGDDFLVSGDKNFRPINLRWGPNGEIYCIDWHDQNPCHQTKPDDWDYEHGRVYRIQTKGLKTKKAEDLGLLDGEKLLATAGDLSNPWRYRTALRLLNERNPKELRVSWKPGEMTLSDLWRAGALISGPELPATAQEILLKEIATNKEPALRAALVRIVAERGTIDEPARVKLVAISKSESSSVVRRELASAAHHWMLTNPKVFGVLDSLMDHREDSLDPVIPQLLWLALEADFQRKQPKDIRFHLLESFNHTYPNALITDYLIPRLTRRVMATGKPEALNGCVGFIDETEDLTAKTRCLEGMVAALQNRQVDAPEHWKPVRDALLKLGNKDITILTNKLAVNFRDPEAIKRSLGIAMDAAKSLQERVDAVKDLAIAKPQAALDPLLKLAKDDSQRDLQTEAIRALASYDSPTVANELIAEWSKFSPAMRNEVVNVIASRKEWAKALLTAVGDKKIARTDLNDNTILRIQALNDKNLEAQIEKVWGRIRTTPAELNELINKTRGQLSETRASFAKGKIAFDNHCAKCHKFEGRGFQVGPDIEGAGRDIEYLLVNVLDPNRVIGTPYFMRTITKLNGQTEQGILHAEDDQSVTLKTENAVLKVIQKKDIETMRVQEKSLMPEGFGSNIKIQEFRDLIRYTMANPFITEVEVAVGALMYSEKGPPVVGVHGRIPIPDAGEPVDITISTSVTAPDALKTKLLLGIRNDFRVVVNGKVISGKGSNVAAQSDQIGVEVELKKGDNRIEIGFKHKGKGEAVYARFHDPERKLRYPEPKE